MHMGILFACMSVHYVHVMPEEARESIASPGTAVTGICLPLWGCWELKWNYRQWLTSVGVLGIKVELQTVANHCGGTGN